MAGNLSVAAKNATLSWWATQITAVSVHTANPGSTGASEASGGSYARQTPSFGSPASGSIATGTLAWTLPAGTYTYLGLWAGTTYWGKLLLAVAQTYTGTQTLTVTSITLDQNAVASA